MFENSCESKYLYSDRKRLKQVILNLLSNAIKFAPAGYVELKFAEYDGTLEIVVTDTGKGIPEDKIDKIFDKFVQVHDITEEALSGTGLGLSIVKALTKTMDGQIEVTSMLGSGTQFLSNFPSPK